MELNPIGKGASRAEETPLVPNELDRDCDTGEEDANETSSLLGNHSNRDDNQETAGKRPTPTGLDKARQVNKDVGISQSAQKTGMTEACYFPYEYNRTDQNPLESLSKQEQLLWLTRSGKFHEANNLITEIRASLSQLVKDEYGRTAAHYAGGHSAGGATLQLLVETLGRDCLLVADYDRRAPLHLSAEFHSKEQFDRNHQHFSISEIESWHDRWPATHLHWACGNKTYGDEILLSVAQKLPHCLGFTDLTMKTVLMCATDCLTEGTVKELIKLASPELIALRDEEGNSCLHYAAMRSKDDALLSAVKRIDPKCLGWTKKGQVTVLHLACKNMQKQTVELLLQNSSPELIALRDDQGNSWVHYAARNSGDDEVIIFAVQTAGSDCLGWKNNRQVSVLHLACESMRHRTVEQLLKRASSECVGLKDEQGNLCVHYAARNWRDNDALLSVVDTIGFNCLDWMNNKRVTVLHVACSAMQQHTVEQLMQKASRQSIALRDDQGNSCVHFAAKNLGGDDVLLLVVKKIGPDCLGWKNNEQVTVLHLACKNMQKQTVELLLQNSSPELIALRDDQGNSWVHYAARNSGDDEVIIFAVQTAGSDCLGWKNNRQVSVLHLACESMRHRTVEQLLKRASSECVDLRDEQGNLCVHYAARNSKDNAVLLYAVEKFGPECLGWQNTAKQSVLFFAIGHIKHAEALLDLVRDRTIILQQDVNQDSLLHAMFHLNYFSSDFSQFLDTAISLVKAGVDPRAENHLGQNCLHGTTMSLFMLNRLLQQSLLNDEARRLFQQLMMSSNGLHAVHSFAGRYALKNESMCLVDSLSKLSDMTVSELLNLTVSHEPHKGATCLHFACETGHKTNIKYLKHAGLRLSAETDAGLTCIDFACDKGKFNEVLEFVTRAQLPGCDLLHLLRLLDPGKRALRLPDRSAARQLLASISDESILAAEVHKEHHEHKGHENESRKHEFSEKDKARTDLKLLLRAVEMDSSDIFRCAVRLKLITPDTERLFPVFLWRTLMISKSEMDENFPNRDEFLMCNIADLSIIDTMAFFDKTEILTDIILTRQFDLIPACLSLLIQLKPKIIQMEGKHEQLKQLYSRVTSIAVNALDELYFSADDDKKNLLLNYINGELEDSNGSKGPKFPCRSTFGSKVTYCTVMEMVEDAGDADLFATDCLHQLTERSWHPDRQASCSWVTKAARSCTREANRFKHCCTPRDKFFAHMICFIIFLMLFAWYITDFRRAFQFWLPDVILFAYTVSFTLEEISDFQDRKRFSSFYLRRTMWQLPVYFKDVLNFFDCSALLFMWIGLVWKLVLWGSTDEVLTGSSASAYACQMILSTAFLLWGFRFVSFLSYSDLIGPAISMFKTLLMQDLVPFLSIIFVIAYSFGVFFFNLMFPIITSVPADRDSPDYVKHVFMQMFSLPFNLLFTNFGNIGVEAASNGTDQSLHSVPLMRAHPFGFVLFNKMLIFLFLFIANNVMLNLLIARFSLTVSKMQSKTLGNWRKIYFDMLKEYTRTSPVPPPLSFVCFLVRLWKRRQTPAADKDQEWWLNESDYPEEYKRFLKFQSARLRRMRPKLGRETTRNKSDAEVLMAHAENLTSDSSRDLDDSMQRLEIELGKGQRDCQNSTEKTAQRLQNLEQMLQIMMQKQNDADQRLNSFDRIIQLLEGLQQRH